MEKFPVDGNIRKRIGYVVERMAVYDNKVWIADQDMNNNTDFLVMSDVQYRLHGIINPLSERDVRYTVNYNDTEDVESRKWIANYISKFDSQKSSVVIAYGHTPEEAIINVRALSRNVVRYWKPEGVKEVD